MKRKIKKIENISIKINKGQNITNPGQLGIKPDSFHRSKKKL